MTLHKSTSVDGSHELVFDDRPMTKRRYQLNGETVPGVTTFIKAAMPTPEALQNWKIRKGAEYAWDHCTENANKETVISDARTAWKTDTDEAAGVGVIVHNYAELASLGKHEEALEMLAKYESSEHWGGILNAVHKVDEFNKDNKDEIIATETMVASPINKYAGRFDRLVRRNGRIGITDYKTSKGFYLEQFIQDAMYSAAIFEWLNLSVEFYEVVLFGKEGGDFKQLIVDEPNEMVMLGHMGFSCLQMYQDLKVWNKDPRFAYKKVSK